MCINLSKNSDSLTITTALAEIDRLNPSSISSTGEWTPTQIFIHCAQSVEYSMTGYPSASPAIVQKTVGKVAFSLFSSLGKMVHPLDEPIPDAPSLDSETNLEAAIARLKKAYTDFEQYNGVLYPHFTYGELNKDEYTVAHVMHLNNHLKEIR